MAAAMKDPSVGDLLKNPYCLAPGAEPVAQPDSTTISASSGSGCPQPPPPPTQPQPQPPTQPQPPAQPANPGDTKNCGDFATYAEAKAWFEKALAATERRALQAQVNMARYYAVKTGDRNLFDELLDEVMEAHDPLPEARLANTMARERASMYIENADQLF